MTLTFTVLLLESLLVKRACTRIALAAHLATVRLDEPDPGARSFGYPRDNSARIYNLDARANLLSTKPLHLSSKEES